MNTLLLLIPVILSTLIWPINRWVMLGNGRGDAYGFWISITGASTAGLLSLIFRQSFASPSLWWVGIMVGFAFSVGFCLIVNYCLKIGPTGPTVAVNNMGLVGPVVAGLLWPHSKPLTVQIVVGLGFVVLAFLAFGKSATSQDGEISVTPRWAILAFLGWLFAAASMTGQYLGSVLNSNLPLSQVAVFFFCSTLILMPFLIRYRNQWFNRKELLGGMANGFIQAIGIFVTLEALQRMGAEIVFPVTVLGPVIAVLMISAFLYQERLSRLTWIACLSGIIGLALLAINRV